MGFTDHFRKESSSAEPAEEERRQNVRLSAAAMEYQQALPPSSPIQAPPPPPEIKLIRTDSLHPQGQEVVIPEFEDSDAAHAPKNEANEAATEDSPSRHRRSLFGIHLHKHTRSRSVEIPSDKDVAAIEELPRRSRVSYAGESESGSHRRGLFRRHEAKKSVTSLHSRSSSGASSVNLPDKIPDIDDTNLDDQDREEAWERRAAMLAISASSSHSAITATGPIVDTFAASAPSYRPITPEGRGIVDEQSDQNIQEAIRLHEAGDLERATVLFGKLADPAGPNNALAQVLYGLSLRHGWGCKANPAEAVKYLSLAASSSAVLETTALNSGLKSGGSAKGELTLAMFELANCFRYGWGVESDPAAALQYYLCAANMGDPDAMNETAWCYLQGFGTGKGKHKLDKKDAKMQSARWYREAEKRGSGIVGNSWIYKDKWNPQ
jgi:hypothetical protein